MSKLQSSGGIGCWLATMTLLVGCNQTTPPSVSPDSSAPGSSSLSVASPAVTAHPVETPVTISNPKLPGLSDEDATAVVYRPIVALSTQHEETCKIRVDETFPSLDLKSLDGQLVSLSKEYGKQLTIVVFWNLQHPMGIEQLCHINDEVVDRFQDAGVKVVAINVGDTPDDVKSFMENINCGAKCLLDEESVGFNQIASDILPRTYLLDANGTVCWFDIEYSRSTRRELRNAVIYNLRIQLAAAPELM